MIRSQCQFPARHSGVCIGFANYKAFLLFLIYTCLFATYSSLLSAWTLKDFVDAMPDGFEMAPVGFGELTRQLSACANFTSATQLCS